MKLFAVDLLLNLFTNVVMLCTKEHNILNGISKMQRTKIKINDDINATEVAKTSFFSIFTGYYMYIETSSPRQPGDNAKLQSPKLQFSGNMCLKFFYHMYGSNIGEFKVEINGVIVFSKSGDQKNTWHEMKKDLNLSGMYTVREVFEATLKSLRIKLSQYSNNYNVLATFCF